MTPITVSIDVVDARILDRELEDHVGHKQRILAVRGLPDREAREVNAALRVLRAFLEQLREQLPDLTPPRPACESRPHVDGHNQSHADEGRS